MAPDLGAIEEWRRRDADYGQRLRDLEAATAARNEVQTLSVNPPFWGLHGACQCRAVVWETTAFIYPSGYIWAWQPLSHSRTHGFRTRKFSENTMAACCAKLATQLCKMASFPQLCAAPKPGCCWGRPPGARGVRGVAQGAPGRLHGRLQRDQRPPEGDVPDDHAGRRRRAGAGRLAGPLLGGVHCLMGCACLKGNNQYWH